MASHWLTMLGVDEIGIFAVYLEEVLEHAKHEARDGQHLSKGSESELAWYSYEQCDSQHSKEYPPFFAPCRHEDGHEDRNAYQEDNENGARNECLLDGLVNEIDLAMNEGIGDFGQIAE